VTRGRARVALLALVGAPVVVACAAGTGAAPAARLPADTLVAPSGPHRARVLPADSLRAPFTGRATRRRFVAWDSGSRTAAYVETQDGRPGEAEVHLRADDYHHVLSGRARLAIGGTLDAPRRIRPYEWRAVHAAGADTIELGPGDVLHVPAGTMHQRLAGAPYTVLITKVYADPAAVPRP
jgi:mannose-6-phosphate isomerase-like protein (cupin superfamily)